MKKIAAVILICVVLCSFSSCSQDNDEGRSGARSQSESSDTQLPDISTTEFDVYEYFYGTTEITTDFETDAPTTIAISTESPVTAEPTTEKLAQSPETTQKQIEPTTTKTPTTIAPTTEVPKIFIMYWGNTGDKVHIKPNCSTIKNGVLSGTLEECKAAGHTGGWCQVCSKGWTDERFLKDGNPYAK